MASRNQMALCVAAGVLLLTASTVHGSGQHEAQAGNNGPFVGYRNATIEEIPWLVWLEHLIEHPCAGSVLTERWVLTAAHCIPRGPLRVKSSTSRPEEGGLTHEVKRVIVHELYNKEVHLYNYDVAVLEMEEPFIWTERLQPICCLAVGNPPVGTAVVAPAWSDDADGGIGQLQLVTMIIVDLKQCPCYHTPSKDKYIPPISICARELHPDLCLRKEGGPLVDEVTKVLVGIMSYATDCRHKESPLATSVGQVWHWILEKTGYRGELANTPRSTTSFTERLPWRQ